MRTRITKTDLYKFDELSPEAQETAVEKLWDINVEHDCWWNCIFHDAAGVLLKLDEFDLDSRRHATGDFIEAAIDTANKIVTEDDKTRETWGTATNYLEERGILVARYSDGIATDIVTEDNELDFDQECDELDKEFLRSILEDYSIILQKEYEYLTSKEQIIETIHANNYEFDKSGKIA